MLSNLTGWHFIVILFVVLLLFGAPKLPALARSLGQSAKILKTELRPGDDEATPPAASAAPVASAAPAASAAPSSPSSPAVPTPATPPA
jgi:sec-independent protein translocase protein TatA